MADNNASMFRLVAVGTAAENLALNSNELMVSPHEKLGFMDGEIVDKVDAMEYDHQNSDGKEATGVAFVSNNHPAKWLPTSNRKTPPNIRRGERVKIYQFGSNEQYYWRAFGLDDHLRRLETVVFGINANPAEGQDGADPENMYFIEFSAHKKMITMSTSKKNGEFCTYDLQFDMASGKIILQDDQGNHALFDTANTHILFKNMLGTFLEVNKQDLNGYAPRNIGFTADANVDVKGKKITLDGGGSVFTLQAGGTTLKTPRFDGGS
jgi:hypothetical protein